MNMEKIPVAVVAGPTASGKTSLAIELAKCCGGEIVSADSMQVYAEMRIGTARPDESEMQGIPHHMMGFLSPTESFSVAEYVEQAGRCIEEIHARGKLPILAGGTGLYIRSLLRGIRFSEMPENAALRKELEEASERDPQALWEQLRQADPEAAAAIHPNNRKRVIRALEVFRLTGVPFSVQSRQAAEGESPYRWAMLCLGFHDRQMLYDRINCRVDWMMEQGLLREAENFLKNHPGGTAVQAIGYKELAPYFRGELSLEAAAENIRRETRRYAKRQLTWFRREEGAHWLYVDEPGGSERLLEETLHILRQENILTEERAGG